MFYKLALNQFAAKKSQAPVMAATSFHFFGTCGDDANICQPEADLREGTIHGSHPRGHDNLLIPSWFEKDFTKPVRKQNDTPTYPESLATFIVS